MTPPLPRAAETSFFRTYWKPRSRTRRPYTYQWFLRPCRDIAFAALANAPPGLVLELGSGRGSIVDGERNPNDVRLDIVPLPGHGARFILGDAQRLPFRDESLSGVWGQTILMHLDPTLVAAEAHRVLRPGGVLALVEPLKGHPLVGMARHCLPGRRVGPHFVCLRELRALGVHFRRSEALPFFLFSLLALLAADRMTPAVRTLQRLDITVLRRAPALHSMAWYAVAWFQK